jgi:DeoR family transcriptional regulator, fructose operon transcriptional repressor
MYLEPVDASQRLSELLDLLRRHGRVDVGAAAATFGTAEMTIRRDLDQLAAQGVARRVRGGAVSLLMRGDELPFAMREMEAGDTKRRIGAAVAASIRDGEAVLLDSGTTAIEVAHALADRRLTVMPMSLHAAMALAASRSTRVLLSGGEARPGELAMTGPIARAGIAAVRFDTVVLTACGLGSGTVTAYDLGDAEMKQAMLGAANRVVLAADSSKFGRSSLAVVCDTATVDVLVTDMDAPADEVARLRDAGVEVHCV